LAINDDLTWQLVVGFYWLDTLHASFRGRPGLADMAFKVFQSFDRVWCHRIQFDAALDVCDRFSERLIFGYDDFAAFSWKSPEPTAVAACSSAVAVHVASRRWFSFFR
jgi:hypothetical protein